MTSLLISRHLVPRLTAFVFAIAVLMSACSPDETEESLGLPTDTGTLDALSALSSCKVQPDKFTLLPTKTKQFSVIGYRNDGTSATEPASYTSTGGTVSSSGLYTAGSSTGTFKVKGTLAGTTIKCKATVKIATLTAVHATPDPVTLAPSGGQQFSAVGQFSDASTGPVTVAWSTPSGTNGTVTSSGSYSAPANPGQYKVIAKLVGGTLADTAIVTVAAAAGGYPHQPPGYAQFFRYTASSLPVTTVGGGAQGGNNGAIWRYDPKGHMAIVADAAAPTSPSNVFRLAFPSGMAPGDTPGMIQGWATGDERNSTEYSEVYESTWIRIGDGSGFQTQGALVKILGYWGVGQRGQNYSPSAFFGFIGGTGNTSVLNSWDLGFIQQNFEDRKMMPNVGSKPLVAGRWHRIEMVMKKNTTTTNSNGVLQVWIDGVMTINYTNVQFRNAAHPSGFYAMRWDPIWGGMGGSNRTRTDYLYVDDIYLSGKP